MAKIAEEIINLSENVEMADVLKAAYRYAQHNLNKKFQIDDLYLLMFSDEQSHYAKKYFKNQIQNLLTSPQGLIQRGFISPDTLNKKSKQSYYLNYGEKLIQNAYDHLDPGIYPYFQKLKAGKIKEIKTDFEAIKINALKEITDKVVFMAMCLTRIRNNGYSSRAKTIELIKKQIISEIKNPAGKIHAILKKKYGLVGIGLCESFEDNRPINTEDRILIDEKAIIESMLAKVHQDLLTYYQRALAAPNQFEKNAEGTIENNEETPPTMTPNTIFFSSTFEHSSKRRKTEEGKTLLPQQNMMDAKNNKEKSGDTSCLETELEIILDSEMSY